MDEEKRGMLEGDRTRTAESSNANRPHTPPEQRHQFDRKDAGSPAQSVDSSIPPMSDRASHITLEDNDGLDANNSHHDPRPPSYHEDQLGRIADEQDGTNATITDDGRIDINISQPTRRLSTLLGPALRHSDPGQEPPPPYIPPSLGGSPDQTPPPSMNVVIHVVGSRGDVQPFVALGKVLKETYGHRVRLATHPTFQKFVEENGLEFFSIGGDPAELMAFMVKNPGLMPGFDSLRSGDIGKRRRGIGELIRGCWRSCFEAGDGSGVAVTDKTVAEWMNTSDPKAMTPDAAAAAASSPFVADCIIANPPSFAHIHCAERLGIPLHIMFTMPWSPTQAFPHPLANVQSTTADVSMTNYITYTLVDMLTWQGLGDVINQFRVHTLSLEPISLFWAPGILSRLKVPHTYCWSPALIPKPADWPLYISISGFYFLSLATNYTPEPDLKAFLDAGPPPVYIGFGSIVVDDPNAMTKMIFEAVKATGQRALVSKGWGGLGADELGIPEGVFMLGNVPHDWLFHRVSCVVHHGGAGTTAAGIACGKPTVIVPFFGDQPFWGAMVAKAGAGPTPIPHKELTSEKLADAINFALKPSSLDRAKELAQKISKEDGNQKGAQAFHQMLDVDSVRCSLIPTKPAVWRVKRTQIKLSALAAYSLAYQGVINYDDLKLYRSIEWEADMGPTDPVTGATLAMVGTAGAAIGGMADLPVETLKMLKIHPDATKSKNKDKQKADDKSKSSTSLAAPSTTSLASTSQTSLSSQQAPPSGLQMMAGTAKLGEEAGPVPKPSGDDASSISDSLFSTTTASSTRYEPTISSNTSTDSRSTITGKETDPGQQTPSNSQFLNVPSAGSERGRSSSMADALHNLPSDSRPHSAGSSSRRDSSSQATSQGNKSSYSFQSQASQYAPDPLDTVYGTGKGLSKIVGAGLKSPLDFTMAVSKGFHNMPRLYGEEPRQVGRVTGVGSGFRTAGKEFGIGMVDGIFGLVTQPLDGARKGGASGFFKGIGRGIAGVVVKPSAAAYALPAYAMQGIYKEIQKRFGENVGSYIIAARVAQGYGEWMHIDEEQRREIVHKWAECLSEVKGRRGFGKKKEGGGKSLSAMKEFVDKRKEKRKTKYTKDKEAKAYEAAVLTPSPSPSPAASRSNLQIPQGSSTPSNLSSQNLAADADHEDAELEEAIRLSLKIEESHAREIAGVQHDEQNEEERQMKEAIAKSLEQMRQVDDEHEEEEFKRAVEESMKHRGQGEGDGVTASSSGRRYDQQSQGHDQAHHPGGEDDEELTKALEQSKRENDEEEKRRQHEEDVIMEYVRKQSLAEEEYRRQRTGR